MDSNRFIELAQDHAAVDYGSKPSVRAGNSAAEELRAMARAALASANGTEKLIGLLNHPTAGSWAAYTALELGDLSEFQRARCLAVIQALARGDSLAGIGARAWLSYHGYEG